MSTVIKVENLSKRYRLGVINRDMLYKDLQSRWAKFRGKEDPNAPIGFKHDKRLEHGDEFWALRNVDLEVKEGEILGIIGRNGAGKSTLLKILSQITAPTEGKIKVKGRIASLLEVGTGFHPELTGRENVYLNGAILGMTRKEVRSKFDEIVAFADIHEFIDTPVKRYSSGMYVRLAFAVAAHLDPDVLIVDEVLAVGDVAFQKKCIGKMRSIKSEGRTIVLVTHSMALVEALAHRCVWMEDGEVRDSGPVHHIASFYVKSSQKSVIGLTEGLENYRLRRGTGQVRVTGFSIRNDQREPTTEFSEGDLIVFHIELTVMKACCDLAISIAFKLGASGEHLFKTPLTQISGDPLAVGETISLCLEVRAEGVIPALYDLYVWLGPEKPEIFDEFYDILDGMLSPIEILDSDSDGASKTLPTLLKRN
jgi:ABC-type polysaccharide/polyol phosphate transport system ATPase subunit